MSKIHKLIDRYVRVEVDTRYRKDPIPTRQECDGIAKSVRRHVDDVIRAFTIDDYANACEFCGANWTEDSDSYNGGCCDKDEANNPKPATP